MRHLGSSQCTVFLPCGTVIKRTIPNSGRPNISFLRLPQYRTGGVHIPSSFPVYPPYLQIAPALITSAGLMFSFHKAPSWYPTDSELIKYEGHIFIIFPAFTFCYYCRGAGEAPDWPSLSITLQVRCRRPAPVRLEVSAADRLQAAPSRALKGRLWHGQCMSLHLGAACF